MLLSFVIGREDEEGRKGIMTNSRHLVQIYGIAYEPTRSARGLVLSISSFSEPTQIQSSLLAHPQYLEPGTE